ncbi:MAG: hypothetical protein L6416_11595, partial [Candidatus Omnitrophica bacterium]|nr:hypothetical protein [Candidatus Omnitrophota bacterium]
EEERIAFCQFLEGLIKDIKQIDPNHPVIYASAAYLNLKYLKKYVPSLDMFGINAYCSIRFIHGAWDVLEIAKPYVITEYGPYLPNDSHRDTNGKPVELGDYQKAMIYRDYTEQIEGFAGYNLGGFAFHLGETSQESMTWWNLNEGESKKQSYWAIYAKYKDGLAPYQTPQIENLVISKVDNLMPNEIIDVEVRLKDAKAENFYFEYKMSTAEEGILKYYVNEYIDINVIGKGNSVKVEVPKQSGFYRLYCFVKDMNGNVSCMNKSISVSQINALKNK